MSIRELMRTLWFGRWLILASVVAVVLGAMFYQSRQETYYDSSAVVEIASVTEQSNTETTSTLAIDANPALVASTDIARVAAEALGRPEDVALLASQVSGSFTSDPTRVAITATTTEPQVGQAVANAFAAAYIEHLEVLWEEELAEIDARLENLRERYSEIAGRLQVNPNDPFAEVERQTVINQYQALSAEKSGAQSLVTAGQVVDPANTSLALGFGPRSIFAVAALIGLLAGVGLAFARRALDMRVRSAGDASHLASVPVLAEIYDVQGSVAASRKQGSLPVSSRTASPFTESMRELRTSTQVSVGGGLRSSIVVVTAADPDAPRAFLTANLAASWALSGRTTIVVSGDLRRPQLDKLLPAPEGWRAPRLGPDEPLIRPTRVPNLRLCILPDEEMDPADYLATEWARTFIESLREQAGVVVIDAPPVLAAADATILGGYSDGAVIIATSGRTDREVLAQAAERLRAGHVNVLGVAFAGVEGQSRVLYASTYGEPVEDEQGEDAAEATEEEAPARASVPAEVVDGGDAGETKDAGATAAKPAPAPTTRALSGGRRSS